MSICSHVKKKIRKIFIPEMYGNFCSQLLSYCWKRKELSIVAYTYVLKYRNNVTIFTTIGIK